MGTGGKTPTGTKVRIYPRGTRASPKRRHGHAPSPREVSDLSALPDGLKADYAQRALRTGPGGHADHNAQVVNLGLDYRLLTGHGPGSGNSASALWPKIWLVRHINRREHGLW